MKIIDSHFHWWPRSFFDALCRRGDYPRAEPTPEGGYNYWRRKGSTGLLNLEPEWFDLDQELVNMDALGHEISVVCSIGPLSVHFSDGRGGTRFPPMEAWGDKSRWRRSRPWGTATP